MSYTFPAQVAWNVNGSTPVPNVSFQVYAVADTTFSTPLAITDTNGNPLAGNILSSGRFGVFPQFMQAGNATVVITDAAHVYAWTLNCIPSDASTAAFINNGGSATAAALNATYAPVSGSANYAPATGSATYETQTHAAATYDPLTVGGKGTVRKDELLINVKDYGAVGDGVTDDGTAIRNAVVAAAGRVLFFPAGTYYYKATGVLQIAANTTLTGVRGASVINFDVVTAGTYTEFARNNGNNVTIENLAINRASDFPSVFFPWQAYASFTLRNCAFNGNRDIYTTNYCHGIQTGVQNSGTTSNLLVTGTTFQKFVYALFQTNASTATVTGMTFRDCLFTNNYGTDLEFNSPFGTTNGVLVDSCTFQNNQATTAGAGFGVGLAFVKQAVIRNCTFTNYYNEAIHIEDYSARVNVENNKFTACGLNQGSYIQVISGAFGINLSNNQIDGTANTNFVAVFNILAGGTGTTPGGRTVIAPSDVTVTGNTVLAGGLNGIYCESTLRTIIANNRFRGAGSYNTGTQTYGGANGGWCIDLYDGDGIAVTGNHITGFNQAFRVHTNTILTGGSGFAITGNDITQCGYGIGLINTGSGVVSGNIITKCERPMIAGTGNTAAFPVVVTGNHAYNCKFQMEIGGKLIVRANGTASIGSAVTLAVLSVGLALPSGTVITFSGGGVLTLTSAASAGATSLTGNLATANIASAETALVTGLAHSTVTAQNHITMSGNGDSVAGTY